MRSSLTIGPLHTLVQNEVYALPSKLVHVFSSVALQASNDPAFVASVAVAANTTVPVAAAFIRCATGAAIVRLVAA